MDRTEIGETMKYFKNKNNEYFACDQNVDPIKSAISSFPMGFFAHFMDAFNELWRIFPGLKLFQRQFRYF